MSTVARRNGDEGTPGFYCSAICKQNKTDSNWTLCFPAGKTPIPEPQRYYTGYGICKVQPNSLVDDLSCIRPYRAIQVAVRSSPVLGERVHGDPEWDQRGSVLRSYRTVNDTSFSLTIEILSAQPV